MPTNPALTLAQWFSPGFPVGAFAYSHGLEWAISEGRIASAEDLRLWCEALLTHGTGRNDAILLFAAHRAETDQDLDAFDDLARAFCTASGRVTETEEQGAAFARTLSGMGFAEVAPHAYPVVVGAAAKTAGLPIELTAQFYLQAFVANLVSVAVRRVPLGQTAGQRILQDMQNVITKAVQVTEPLTPDDLMSSAFVADIAAMNQETLYSRSFRT